MIYDNNKFILNDNIVSKSWQNMEMMDQIIIPTKLTKKFLKQYIQNRYEDIDSISLKELNKLIVEFEMSNLDTTRFLIKKYTMILVPFMYVIMAIIPYAKDKRGTSFFINFIYQYAFTYKAFLA